jgi:methylmalonyl-CoA mutase C-terminal domain/subunit
MTLFPRILELLRGEGMDHVLVIGGGIIPEEDIRTLEGLGVAKLFGPGTPTTAPIDFVREHFGLTGDGAVDGERGPEPAGRGADRG